MHAHLLPVCGEGAHFLGHIAHDVALKPARMRGKHRRGQRDGLHAARGNDGQCHAQRALADAGKVVNQRRALDAGIVNSLVHKFFLLIVYS